MNRFPWRLRALAPLALALTFTAGCSPLAADAPATERTATVAARHAESGLPVVPLAIVSGDRRHAFRVELARTPDEQARGLMFRTAMGADEGMIFPFDPHKRASFWMRNTVIPLDLVFIGGDRRIESIAADAVPYSLAPIVSRGAVAAVLELNGGRAAELGLKPGDLVEW